MRALRNIRGTTDQTKKAKRRAPLPLGGRCPVTGRLQISAGPGKTRRQQRKGKKRRTKSDTYLEAISIGWIRRANCSEAAGDEDKAGRVKGWATAAAAAKTERPNTNKKTPTKHKRDTPRSAAGRDVHEQAGKSKQIEITEEAHVSRCDGLGTCVCGAAAARRRRRSTRNSVPTIRYWVFTGFQPRRRLGLSLELKANWLSRWRW